MSIFVPHGPVVARERRRRSATPEPRTAARRVRDDSRSTRRAAPPTPSRSVGMRERPWLTRIMGLASSVPVLPQLGLGAPLSVALSIGAVLTVPGRAGKRKLHLLIEAFAVASAVFVWLSSLVNDTPLAIDSVGHALIFAISLASYGRLITTETEAARMIAWFYGGFLAYLSIHGFDSRALDTGINGFWKFGIGTPVTIVVLYVVIRRGASAFQSTLFVLMAGALSFVVGFRALGVACFASVLVAAVRVILPKGRLIVKAAALAVALWVLAWALEQGVILGLFGQDVGARTASQVIEGGMPVFGGRSEAPLSVAAISLKPLIGWGNSQYLDSEAISLGVVNAEALGMGGPENYMNYWVRGDGFISLHSMALGQWVDGGIFAAAFPISLLVLFIIAAIEARGRWAPLVALVSVNTGWDLMFSPWSTNRGVQLAMTSALCLVVVLGRIRNEPERMEARDVGFHPRKA
jgi:hypothetical protein